jgi:hypothetical protein
MQRKKITDSFKKLFRSFIEYPIIRRGMGKSSNGIRRSP